MNLTIKDLSTSIELDRAAMTPVPGGAAANSHVQSGRASRRDIVTDDE
jgi:hypothetical protein